MEKFKHTKLLGSDFDDTITANSMEVYTQLYLESLSSIGITLKQEEFKEIVQPVWGQSSDKVIGFVAAQLSTEQRYGHQLNPDDILQAVEQYEENLRSGRFVNCIELVPKAVESLESVRSRGVQIGIATGLPTDLFHQILEKNGVPQDLFMEPLSAYRIRRQKPHPYSLEVLKNVAQVIRGVIISNREIVYVGDSPNDIKMADSMKGVEPVAVLTGNLTTESAAALRQNLKLPRLQILKNICQIEKVLEERELTAI